MAGEVGLGKTRAVLEALRDVDLELTRVHWFVPDHKLASDIAERSPVPARRHYGRDQTTNDAGVAMCFDEMRLKAE